MTDSATSTYPPEAREALESLGVRLRPLDDAIISVAVYGSVARGDYLPGRSDINVVVVLHSAEQSVLRLLRPILRSAWFEARVASFVVTKREVQGIADVFPIKVADIQACHDVLIGEDCFRDLDVDAGNLRLRTEQELRNHLLRLRRHFLRTGDDAVELARALRSSASSLPIELWALARLTGTVLEGTTATERLEHAARLFDLDATVLRSLGRLREGERHSEEAVRSLFFAVMTQLERAIERVDRLEVA